MKYAPSFVADLAAVVAPNSMCKRGVLTVDNVRRWVALEDGALRVYADESGCEEKKLLLDVNMQWVEVICSSILNPMLRISLISRRMHFRYVSSIV